MHPEVQSSPGQTDIHQQNIKNVHAHIPLSEPLSLFCLLTPLSGPQGGGKPMK